MPRRDFSVSPLERQFISFRVKQTNSLREINSITQSNVGADLRVCPGSGRRGLSSRGRHAGLPLRCGCNNYSKTISLSHSLVCPTLRRQFVFENTREVLTIVGVAGGFPMFTWRGNLT